MVRALAAIVAVHLGDARRCGWGPERACAPGGKSTTSLGWAIWSEPPGKKSGHILSESLPSEKLCSVCFASMRIDDRKPTNAWKDGVDVYRDRSSVRKGRLFLPQTLLRKRFRCCASLATGSCCPRGRKKHWASRTPAGRVGFKLRFRGGISRASLWRQTIVGTLMVAAVEQSIQGEAARVLAVYWRPESDSKRLLWC